MRLVIDSPDFSSEAIIRGNFATAKWPLQSGDFQVPAIGTSLIELVCTRDTSEHVRGRPKRYYSMQGPSYVDL